MNKILTVSIAAYNVQSYLPKTLDPFLRISMPERIEVLIIDDGSHDDTYKIAKSYQKQYPDIFKVIHKENGGWGSTVTTGIMHARGKYFKLLDGDDFYEEEDLSKFVDCLENCEIDMITTPFSRYIDGAGKKESVKNSFFEVSDPTCICIDNIPIYPYCMEMYSLAFRTSLLKASRVSITERCFYTDNEYVVKCSGLCTTAMVAPFCVYCYRVDRPGQSVSLAGMEKHYPEFEYILKSMLTYILDHIENKHMRELFYDRFKRLSYYYLESLVRMRTDKRHKEALIRFDEWLKQYHSDIYFSVRFTSLRILRLTNYVGYRVVKRIK